MSDARFSNWAIVMGSRARRAHCSSAERLYSAPEWETNARGTGAVDYADAMVIDYCVRSVCDAEREILRRHYIFGNHPLLILRIIGSPILNLRRWPGILETARANALAFERFAVNEAAHYT